MRHTKTAPHLVSYNMQNELSAPKKCVAYHFLHEPQTSANVGQNEAWRLATSGNEPKTAISSTQLTRWNEVRERNIILSHRSKRYHSLLYRVVHEYGNSNQSPRLPKLNHSYCGLCVKTFCGISTDEDHANKFPYCHDLWAPQQGKFF